MFSWVKEKAKWTWEKIKDAGKWVKKRFKKALIVLGVGGAITLAAGIPREKPPKTFEEFMLLARQAIEVEQDANFQQHGKFKRFSKETDWNAKLVIENALPFEIETNEFYREPGHYLGEGFGYQIIFTWEEGEDKYFQSWAYGIDADIHTYDKTLIVPVDDLFIDN